MARFYEGKACKRRSLRRIYAAPRRSLFANKVRFLTFFICTLVVAAVCRILVVAGFCKAKYWKWHSRDLRSKNHDEVSSHFAQAGTNKSSVELQISLRKAKCESSAHTHHTRFALSSVHRLLWIFSCKATKNTYVDFSVLAQGNILRCFFINPNCLISYTHFCRYVDFVNSIFAYGNRYILLRNIRYAPDGALCTKYRA